MRLVLSALTFTLLASTAHAGLGDSLRELRGTVSEITSTSREVGELNKEVGASSPSKASAEIKSGDTLVPKMNKVKVLKEADKKSGRLLQLSKSDELIYMGEEKNGMYRVTSSEGDGWVDKLLVKKP